MGNSTVTYQVFSKCHFLLLQGKVFPGLEEATIQSSAWGSKAKEIPLGTHSFNFFSSTKQISF